MTKSTLRRQTLSNCDTVPQIRFYTSSQHRYRHSERRIRHFIENGNVTVLFVSHSMDQMERIWQRAAWIEITSEMLV